MIHFHGCPITPQSVRNRLVGRNFCVRYGEHRKEDEWAHSYGQSVMLDNGAYSFWTKGNVPMWEDYYCWSERWLAYPTTWAVIPDLIEGSESQNDALLRDWPFEDRGAPVWHLHEPLERLKTLCSMWPRVCLGSSGQYATIGTDAWTRRMDEAFDAICGNGPVPIWIHGLRMMSCSGKDWPLASVDSTDVARNHAGNNDGRNRKDPVRMVERWDACQCPARWIKREQLTLAALAGEDDG